MKYKFRIYGERNSGTNYMKQLLLKHFPIEVINPQYIKVNNVTYVSDWKHETPSPKKTHFIDVLMIRKLVPWLVSFYKKQWQLTKKKKFLDFLTQLLEPSKIRNEMMYNHRDKYVNYRDENLSIFALRYLKWNELHSYFLRNQNVILVQLDALQSSEDTCKLLLKSINDRYKLVPPEYFQYDPILFYKSIKTEIYVPKLLPKLSSMETDVILKNRNEKEEKYIDRISFKIK